MKKTKRKEDKWEIDMLVSVTVKKLKKAVEDNVKARNELTEELSK